MSTRAGSRNNVVAGLFVVGSAIMAVVISVIISGAQKRLLPTHTYVFRFAIEDGAPGIKRGSLVNLGGQEVGRVTGVDLVPARVNPDRPGSIDIHVSIRSTITLYEDAFATLERPLLGNTSTINIVTPGTGRLAQFQGASAVLESGEVLTGHIAPPAFLTQAGYGPEQVRQFQAMISQASAVVERVDRITAKFETDVDPTLTKVRGMVDDLKAATADFREKAPRWAERVDQILAKSDDAAAKLNTALDHADGAVRGFKEALDANRPAIDRTIANLQETSDKINKQTVAVLNDTLEKAGRGSQEFTEAASRFNALISQELPNIERMLANLRLASDQIKLTGIEVRRNPWRLLYQPKTKELESELFYDAARTYAQAVSDLRAASEALRAISQTGSNLPETQRQTAGQLQEHLDEAFRRYQDAEKSLLKQMSEKAK